MKKLLVLVCALVFASSLAAAPESLVNAEGKDYKISLSAELGTVFVASHKIQFGATGTLFDFVEDGNQNVLFPFSRFTAELRLFDRHAVVFLYQPLEVFTEAVVDRDVTVYDVTFLAGTPMKLKYGFSFYRASYLYYFIKENNMELGAGLSLQIRNASISFASADGEQFVTSQNIGPVPIIKLAGKYTFDNGIWTGLEADGFYASSEFFNGASFPFEGAIWDISGRAGIELKNGIKPFVNVRFLAGGAKGTSRYEDAEGDGFANNWLNTLSLTLGVVLE